MDLTPYNGREGRKDGREGQARGKGEEGTYF